jgi:hypothetical protein
MKGIKSLENEVPWIRLGQVEAHHGSPFLKSIHGQRDDGNLTIQIIMINRILQILQIAKKRDELNIVTSSNA